MQSKSAEAWGYALLLTRRVLTTSLAGASESQLHEVTELGTLAGCVSDACRNEAELIWPEDLPSARLEPAQTPVEFMYALVRHRAVTEEILMRADEETMQQGWWTTAKRLAQDPPQSLAASLQQLALMEFAAATKASMIRSRIDAGYQPQPDLVERAQNAIAAAR